MRLISHRGNINGIESVHENNPNYIENAIMLGFDVEIDMIGDLELESDNGDGSMNSSD